MLGICGKRCFIEFGNNDMDAGLDVDKNGDGRMTFKNKNSEDDADYPVELRFINVKSLNKFISALTDLKSKMEK